MSLETILRPVPFLVIILLAVAIAASNRGLTPSSASADGSTHLVVALRGTAEGKPGIVPDYNGDGAGDPGTCFDIDLVDLSTGQVIGTAEDCLSDIQGDPIAGMNLIGTTTFNFPEGTIESRGRTTVQHLLDSNGEQAIIDGFTHGTSSPSPADGSSNILSSDGAFENAEGSVRLSGLVNLEKLGDGFITFDCIFTIDLVGDFDAPVGSIAPPNTGDAGLVDGGGESTSWLLSVVVLASLLGGGIVLLRTRAGIGSTSLH